MLVRLDRLIVDVVVVGTIGATSAFGSGTGGFDVCMIGDGLADAGFG